MTRDQLQDFFCLPTCDEQEEFEELTALAMQHAAEGDCVLAAEYLNKASDLALDKLEESQCKAQTD